MRLLLTLFTKELRSFFFSPIAYVVLALVMIINGLSFRAAVSVLEMKPQSTSLATWTFTSQWFWLSYFFVFPLLTMRLFAEERKLGTWETLCTAPVRTWQIVISKYFASVVFYCLLWVPSLANFAIFQTMTGGAAEIPEGTLLGTYILIFAMGLFNLSMGCLASALTANQIVAAVVSFTASLCHFLLGVLIIYFYGAETRAFVDFVYYITTVQHIETFTHGLLDTRPLVYYTSLSFLFLVITHQVLEFRRWRV